MEVKEDFYMYRSGVYRYSSPPQPPTSSANRTGYHSVRIIGYIIGLVLTLSPTEPILNSH